MLEESFGESTGYEQAELLLRVYGVLTRLVLPHGHNHIFSVMSALRILPTQSRYQHEVRNDEQHLNRNDEQHLNLYTWSLCKLADG